MNFKIILFLLTISINMISQMNCEMCPLPNGCKIQKMKRIINQLLATEYIEEFWGETGLGCDISDTNFQFTWKWLEDFKMRNNVSCRDRNRYESCILEIATSNQQHAIIDISLNIESLLYFVCEKCPLEVPQFQVPEFYVRIVNLKGFGLNFMKSGNYKGLFISTINLINTHLSFYYSNKTRVKLCDNLPDSINSIFQLRYHVTSSLDLIHCVYKYKICPLVFKNAHISTMTIWGMTKTFYKENVLSFVNSTFEDLHSQIKHLALYNADNIDLSKDFLNPSVFLNLNNMHIFSQINLIDVDVFKSLKNFRNINFIASHFRKIMHNNGIAWIKSINNHVKFNISDPIFEFLDHDVAIILEILKYNYQTESQIFPDEDFCLYKDFPFEQLIYIVLNTEINFSCTFLWLIQYYSTIVSFIYYSINHDVEKKMRIIMESKLPRPNCDFDSMVNWCNQSNYHVEKQWSIIDTFTLNKKTEIAIQILHYLFSFLGIFTNSLIILIILRKQNSDLFKEFKQYSYLCCNSVFSIIIFCVQLLSWMSECIDSYDIFCPEIHKYVALQFFKVIFKECLVNTLIFMWNFGYVAFSLNRLSLIGQEHSKLVEFMSKVSVKKYIGVTFLVSIGLSIVKGFKFRINYGDGLLSFPESKEKDMTLIAEIGSNWNKDAFFIANLVCDLLNHVVFLFVNFILDLITVVKLRQTLNEKTDRMEKLKLSSNKNGEKTKKNEESPLKKLIKLVIINTTFGILVKLPLAFIPIVNLIAEFVFKNMIWNRNHNKNVDINFYWFYDDLVQSYLLFVISEFGDLIFTLFISIQLIIYVRFDKKMNTAFHRLLSDIKEKVKKTNPKNAKN